MRHLPTSRAFILLWGALSRCWADANPGTVFRDLGGKQFSSCRSRCLRLWLSPSLLGGRKGLLPALCETGEAVEAPQGKVTSVRSPSLLGLPCPQQPLHPQKTRPGPGPHLGGLPGSEAGCPRNPPNLAACALVLQSTDSAARITAGWKVWKHLSLLAHSMGLSVPIC